MTNMTQRGLPYLLVLLILLCVAWLMYGCAPTRPTEPSAPVGMVDTTGNSTHKEPNPSQLTINSSHKPLTPAQERRLIRTQAKAQARVLKASKPAAPLIAGKGSVWAPEASQVVNTWKPKAPVVVADSGAQVAAATDGVAQSGTGHSATQIKPEAPKWHAYLLSPIGRMLGAAVVGACLWFAVAAWRRKKSTDTTV